eukprot:jgi/Chlat1/3987/Chrsp26S04068
MEEYSLLLSAILSCFAIAGLLACRTVYVVFAKPALKKKKKQDDKVSVLIVLGSGGHTAEMLNIVDTLDLKRYTPRCYVVAASDKMSARRAHELEQQKGALTDCSCEVIPRSREVGQTWSSSFVTTAYACLHALYFVAKHRPQLMLCNGPGTCLPLCWAAFFFKVWGWCNTIVVYVESIARVEKLSLTGLLLYKLRLADQMYVQWPGLVELYPRTKLVPRIF